jgi:hypothetical protein
MWLSYLLGRLHDVRKSANGLLFIVSGHVFQLISPLHSLGKRMRFLILREAIKNKYKAVIVTFILY